MRRSFLLFIFSIVFPLVARAVPISGKVVGPDGAPVAGAEVVVTSYAPRAEPRNVTLRTDATGAFRLDLEPAAYIADIFGRAVAHKPGLAAGGLLLRRDDNIIELGRSASVSGRVVNADGQPQAGVQVALIVVFRTKKPRADIVLYESPLQTAFATTTNDQGVWTLNDLPQAGVSRFGLKDARFAPAKVEVKLEENRDAPPLVARPGGVVMGRVVDAAGQPVAGAQLSVLGDISQHTTNAEGAFQLKGLADGPVRGFIEEPSGARVAALPENAIAREGKTVDVGDITITPGALVTGRVTDATSGQGIANANISGGESGAFAWSDERGDFRLRLPPGHHKVHLSSPPAGYLYPRDDHPLELDLREGQVQTVPFQLERALSLEGVAVDENGRPVAGAKLSFQSDDSQSPYGLPSGRTDENGVWEIGGLRAGAGQLKAEGTWEVAPPVRVVLPHEGALRVVLRRLPSLTLAGRAVTPGGEPVAGAEIKTAILLPIDGEPSSFHNDNRAPLTTGDDGRFALDNLRADARITLTAHKNGYRFVSGGEVTKKDGQFRAADIVLEPLSFHLSGQVTDENGQPVRGARVLSPDGDDQARATTDAEGRFVLKALPAGGVLVVAAHDGKFGEARSEGTIHITLRAPQPPPPGDVWGAFAILQEAWQQSQDTKYYARTHLPLAIAPYDPDLALQMATDPYGHVPDSVLSGTIAALAGYDPMRAVLWAPPQLARITDAQERQNTRLQLGLSIAEIAPDIAAQLYQQAERHWRARAGFNSPGRQIYDFIGLGRLAATLQRDDARQWFDRAFASAEQLPGNERAGLMRVTLEAMAPYFPQQTEKLAPQLPEEGNASAGWTLSQVVRALAPVDLAAAQRLLKTLRERPNTEEYVLGQAERTVAVELAKTDSVAALQIAHAIPEARFRAQALASVAAKLPPERGSAVFREAFGAVAADNFSLDTMARIAALAYNADPALGHELFQQIQERASNRREYLPDVETGARAAAAFYLARDDAAAARLLLETEYSRLRALGANGAWDLTKIAQAMAAVDAGRALEIARSIPASGETVNARFDALRKIAQYLLAAQDVRATLPFDRWGASDTWTPGQDGGW